MATRKTDRVDLALVKRTAPRRGPSSSEDYNDSLDEIISSFSTLARRFNESVVPLHSTLPDGTDDTLVDAFKNGLDGRTIYVDSSLTNLATDLTYYYSAKDRPYTIQESLENLYAYIDAANETTRATAASLVQPITTAQKVRIGINIFDSLQSSSSTSLDGKSETNRLNLIQIGNDLYDSSFVSLDGDGLPNLTFSVRDMVNALLQAHGGAWDADIDLIHSGITVTQADVGASSVYDDAFAAFPTNLEEDLNQVRTQIRRLAGAGSWTGALTPLYVAGADSLEDLLATTKGSGTKTVVNPWGYYYTDVEDLDTVLSDIGIFIGQSTPFDTTPSYTSSDFVTNGDPLNDAISDLDNGLGWASTPGEFRSGEQFRRMEEGFAGSGLIMNHNKNAYPMVQFIQIDPSPVLFGHPMIMPHYIQHFSRDSFQLAITSGTVVSGVCLAQW